MMRDWLPSALKKINIYFSSSLPFLNTLSLPSTFFPHLSVVSLLFSITLSVVSRLFLTLSVVSLFSHTFCCLLFFLKHIQLSLPFKKNIVPLFSQLVAFGIKKIINIYIYFSSSLPFFLTFHSSPFFL